MNPTGQKRKLRSQIAAVIIILQLICIFAMFAINGLFLERYYIARKADSLLEMKEYLETLDISGSVFSESDEDNYILKEEDIPDDIRKDSSKGNFSWVIISYDNQILAHIGDNHFNLADRLFGYIYDLDFMNTKGKIIEDKDTYTIQQTHDRFTSNDYIEIWGILKNDNYFLVRTPLDSIQESAAISNRFYIFVGLITILLSGAIIWILTDRMTKPIIELTDLSKQMANLDFEARYQSHANNEIDVLGDNFNKMSSQLEKTISELKTANLTLEQDIQDKIKIDEMRKEFLDNVSHELKTPIALIQGYAEGLKEGITEDPESMDFYCDVIMDEAQKMNKLVKNLLLLNQLESGKDPVVMERFDLRTLIQSVIGKMDILIRQKEAKVLFEDTEAIYVWADEFKTEQVVTNYLSNALNHLDGEKLIEICIIREQDKVKVSVFNTGKPISEDEIPKLWNKFYKVDKARTREYGGSGIGLSIVKAVLDSMNQSYDVKNYANGVAFTFTLDLK